MIAKRFFGDHMEQSRRPCDGRVAHPNQGDGPVTRRPASQLSAVCGLGWSPRFRRCAIRTGWGGPSDPIEDQSAPQGILAIRPAGKQQVIHGDNSDA